MGAGCGDVMAHPSRTVSAPRAGSHSYGLNLYIYIYTVNFSHAYLASVFNRQMDVT